MKINKIFAAHVRRYRKARGLSQEELAEKAGLHRTYIGFVERAERNITLLNAQKIAKALDVTLSQCVAITAAKKNED